MSDEIMLTEHLEKPALPPAWDYDTSVDKAKISINKWKNVTIEFLCELWIAREKLSVSWEEKQRTSSGTFVPLDKTWDSYCDDIGIEKRTANRWLQRTFELSNNIHISDDSYEWYTPP